MRNTNGLWFQSKLSFLPPAPILPVVVPMIWPVALSAAFLSSCGGGSALEPRYVAVHNAMTATGLVQSGPIVQGSVDEGRNNVHEASFAQPGCFTLVGIGSGPSNLDVEVLDAQGHVLAQDNTQDAQPTTHFCPPFLGTFSVRVTARNGGGSYILSTYSGGGEMGMRQGQGGMGQGGMGQGGMGGFGSEPRAVVRPPHGGPGTCDAPHPLTLGQETSGDTNTGDSVTAGTCLGGGSAPEVIYSFQIDVRSQVRATLSSTYDGALYLLGSCGDITTELACNDDAGSTERSVVTAALEPGTYYLAVDGFGDVMGTYRVRVDATPLRPVSDICREATPIVFGTPVSGNTEASSNYFEAACADRAASPDRVYTFELAERSRVRARLMSTHDGALHLRSSCVDDNTVIACNDDAPDPRHSEITTVLDTGRYYVVADGFGDANSGDYSLTVDAVAERSIGGATGDSCSNATPLVAGPSVAFDSFPARDDTSGTCGGQGAPDLVYRVDITSRSRLRVTPADANFPVVLYLRRTCETASTELACASPLLGGSTLEQTLNPGSYYLFVDGMDGAAVGHGSLQIDLTDLGALETTCRTAPLLRPGTQVAAGTAGHTDRFQATCAGGTHSPDLVYRLSIRRRSRVRISSEQADFDGAIYVRTDCGDSGSEVACNDDAGDNRHSMIETVLEPGNYFVFVDGFGENQQGNFTLDVDVTNP